jgi:hypothetical protein
MIGAHDVGIVPCPSLLAPACDPELAMQGRLALSLRDRSARRDGGRTLEGPERLMKRTGLVVDDDQSTRFVLSRALRELGFNVVSAEDGSDVPGLIVAQRFDLLVLDLYSCAGRTRGSFPHHGHRQTYVFWSSPARATRLRSPTPRRWVRTSISSSRSTSSCSIEPCGDSSLPRRAPRQARSTRRRPAPTECGTGSLQSGGA